MIMFLTLVLASAVMLGIGIKHDEFILVVIAYTFGLFIAYSYGRFIELRRATAFLRKITGDSND